MPERFTTIIASLAFLVMYFRWPVHRRISDYRTPETTTKDQSPSSFSSTPSSDGCIGVTFERGYYHYDRFLIKRSLRPSEFKMTQRGNLHVPRLGKERLQNEAESLRFFRRISNIPVPTVRRGHVTALEAQKKIVHAEVNQHLTTLHEIKSGNIGGPSGIIIPPYRVMKCTDNDAWAPKISDDGEYVFCHNDLSQQNIIVDPESLRIRAIIDWEYAGFYPEKFEAHFLQETRTVSGI